ncbi:MAG: type II secretion system protein [Clostridia bacterium]|nr:type II secretion system protein [Clostridia bacterium]
MNIKNEKGVTLVALIVTIIVMIILASIAISASIGNNGLIEQTKVGTIKASIREVQEALDTYILLKDKELIKNGDYSGVKPNDLIEANVLTPTGTENVYKVNIINLEIKGDYGKGIASTDIFKSTYDIANNEYIVSYVDSEGKTINN